MIIFFYDFLFSDIETYLQHINTKIITNLILIQVQFLQLKPTIYAIKTYNFAHK